MKASVHNVVALSYDDYLQRQRDQWVLIWPGQTVSVTYTVVSSLLSF